MQRPTDPPATAAIRSTTTFRPSSRDGMSAANAATARAAAREQAARRQHPESRAHGLRQRTDTCIQCTRRAAPSQAQSRKYYDWPVGYHVGLNAARLLAARRSQAGELTFTRFSRGTAHKNRMQGNDFVQSVMYRRGVTCSIDGRHWKLAAAPKTRKSDLYGTATVPVSRNGPREATLAEHTHHKEGSPAAIAWPATCRN